jgi:hypothetical protein
VFLSVQSLYTALVPEKKKVIAKPIAVPKKKKK